MSLEKRALSLGLANAFDYAIRFLMPIVLVRALDPESFGQYRQLWLVAYTMLTLLTFHIPYGLYYFLPRTDPQRRRVYVTQAIIFMSVMGMLGGVGLWLIDGLLPSTMGSLFDHGLLVHAFVVLWVATSMLDTLPSVGEHVAWQAKTVVGLSLLKAAVVSAAALLTGEMTAVLIALVVVSLYRLFLLLRYVKQHYGLQRPLVDRDMFREQIGYSAPFAVSALLFGLRKHGGDWIAASLFSVAQFAAFSIASALTPIVVILRQSVRQAFMPSMSRQHADQDTAGMLALNSKANILVGTIAFPAVAFCFVFAKPLISLMFTDAYLEAVPVMRIYCFALATYVVELNSLMMLLRQGAYGARINVFNLCVALPVSFVAALTLGLPGVALGVVAADCVERVAMLLRISKVSGVPVARLQDWRRLCGILVAAIGSAAVVYEVIEHSAWAKGSFMMLAGGALLMALAYPAALLLTGQRALLMRIPGFFRTAKA